MLWNRILHHRLYENSHLELAFSIPFMGWAESVHRRCDGGLNKTCGAVRRTNGYRVIELLGTFISQSAVALGVFKHCGLIIFRFFISDPLIWVTGKRSVGRPLNKWTLRGLRQMCSRNSIFFINAWRWYWHSRKFTAVSLFCPILH